MFRLKALPFYGAADPFWQGLQWPCQVLIKLQLADSHVLDQLNADPKREGGASPFLQGFSPRQKPSEAKHS